MTGRRDRNLRRKLREIAVALHISGKANKLAILRCYLQRAYLGVRITGADMAAEALFRRGPRELHRSEAALIAAMLLVPRPAVSTDSWIGRATQRARYGERRLSTLKLPH